MKKIGMIAPAAIVAALVWTAPVEAQAWDTPSFHAPVGGNTFGVAVIEPSGSDIGAMGLWRRAGDVYSLGARAGVFAFDDPAVSVGAEASRLVLLRRNGWPVDAAGTLGFGATFKDGTFARIPVGVTMGRAFETGDWSFVPYIHPRVALDVATGGDDTDTEVRFTTDLGADFYAGPVAVRLGVALGDWNAVGLGVAWHSGGPPALAGLP